MYLIRYTLEVESAGEMIRAARSAAGFSRSELARLARTSRSAISRYESGDTEPTLPVLRRMLRAAGADIAYVPQSSLNEGMLRSPSNHSTDSDPVQSNRLREVLLRAATIKESRAGHVVVNTKMDSQWPVFKDIAKSRDK